MPWIINASTTTTTTMPADDWLVRQETVWLSNIPVAVITKPAASEIQVHYIHADHFNTPRVIVDTSNTPVWRWDSTHDFSVKYYPVFPIRYSAGLTQ